MMEETTETVESRSWLPGGGSDPRSPVAERVAHGRDARAQCSRAAHAAVEFGAERDPVAILGTIRTCARSDGAARDLAGSLSCRTAGT